MGRARKGKGALEGLGLGLRLKRAILKVSVWVRLRGWGGGSCGLRRCEVWKEGVGVIWVGELDTPELPCTCLICTVGEFCWNKLKLGCCLALRVGEYGLLHKTTIKP